MATWRVAQCRGNGARFEESRCGVAFVGIGCLSVDMRAGCKMSEGEVSAVVVQDVWNGVQHEPVERPSRQALPSFFNDELLQCGGQSSSSPQQLPPLVILTAAARGRSTRGFIKEAMHKPLECWLETIPFLQGEGVDVVPWYLPHSDARSKPGTPN